MQVSLVDASMDALPTTRSAMLATALFHRCAGHRSRQAYRKTWQEENRRNFEIGDPGMMGFPMA
jgi:hypothetical protein